jgi:hypothetical protein
MISLEPQLAGSINTLHNAPERIMRRNCRAVGISRRNLRLRRRIPARVLPVSA